MVTESEKAWAKENGLKRTDMITYDDNGKKRIVYKDKNGKLFYVDHRHYVGTFKEYCEKRAR